MDLKTKNALNGRKVKRKIMRKHLNVSMIETAAKDQSEQ